MKTTLVAAWLALSAMPSLLLAAPAPEGIQIVVAPNGDAAGDDGNAGTLASPLATIHAARDRIRAVKSGPGLPPGGVTVCLRGGEHVLNAMEFDPLLGRRPGSPTNNGSAATFRLEREDSGTESSPIVYRSQEGEQATLVRGPDVDFRVSLIINQADYVFFEGIEVRGGRADWMNRPPASRAAAANGEPLLIVVDGQARATVVVADEPSKVARYAAEELVEHVRKATGATLPVVREADMPLARAGHHRIFLGDTTAARRAGLQPEALAPEAFVLQTADGDLYVVGRESDEDPLSQGNPWVGTLHGLYEILERSLGVRWLWPGELGTSIPRTTTVAIAPVDEMVQPPLRYRTWYTNPDIASTAVFLRRHGMGGGQRPFVGHFVQEWWSIYGQEHPEWFALNAKGKRVGPTLCVSNPELRRHLADYRSRPEHTPVRHGAWARGTKYDDFWNGSDVISLGEADSTEYCHCEACAALDAPHPEGLTLRHVWMRRVLADRYAHLWRAVFDRARRINPDVCVTTFLYWQTFHAPLGEVHLGERYHGEFVPWMAKAMWFPMPDDAYRHLEEQWLGWKKTGITMGYRPNYFHGGHGLPFLSTRQAGKFLHFAYAHGNVGWAGDSLFNHWATQGPMLYVHMRLLKAPTMSVDDARAEYFSGFGPAAEPIERYFDAWETFSHEVVNQHVWPRWGVDQLSMAPRIFTPDVFATTGKILDEALTAARQDAQPEYAQRVEFIRRGLDQAAATIKFLGLLDGGAVVLDDRDRFEATRQAWRELHKLRATIETPLPVVDIAALSRNESRYLKNLDALGKEFEDVAQMPLAPTPWSEWRFRADPDQRGLEEGWQQANFDAAAWKPIRVPAAWSRTWVGKLGGYGWYRTTFMFPAEWAGEPVQLQFGGVDEQAWVYVNGELVGEQLVAGPFTVEVPAKLLQPGVQNTLVVRVHNASGDGGILGAVSGAVPHPENRRPLPPQPEGSPGPTKPE